MVTLPSNFGGIFLRDIPTIIAGSEKEMRRKKNAREMKLNETFH